MAAEVRIRVARVVRLDCEVEQMHRPRHGHAFSLTFQAKQPWQMPAFVCWRDTPLNGSIQLDTLPAQELEAADLKMANFGSTPENDFLGVMGHLIQKYQIDLPTIQVCSPAVTSACNYPLACAGAPWPPLPLLCAFRAARGQMLAHHPHGCGLRVCLCWGKLLAYSHWWGHSLTAANLDTQLLQSCDITRTAAVTTAAGATAAVTAEAAAAAISAAAATAAAAAADKFPSMSLSTPAATPAGAAPAASPTPSCCDNPAHAAEASIPTE
eukprot:364785-Chlamydomonas_euryale.AAC.5